MPRNDLAARFRRAGFAAAAESLTEIVMNWLMADATLDAMAAGLHANDGAIEHFADEPNRVRVSYHNSALEAVRAIRNGVDDAK